MIDYATQNEVLLILLPVKKMGDCQMLLIILNNKAYLAFMNLIAS